MNVLQKNVLLKNQKSEEKKNIRKAFFCRY